MLLVAAPLPVWAQGTHGGIRGLVADASGTPIAGAMISIFGSGLGSGGIITLSDDRGRFALSSLPVGAYTLRALGRGHRPAPARKVTVTPDHQADLKVRLTPIDSDADGGIGEARETDAQAVSPVPVPNARPGTRADSARDEAARELRWLLRHKRRSVLETRGHAGGGKQTASFAPAHRPQLEHVTGALALAPGVPIDDHAGRVCGAGVAAPGRPPV